MTWKENPQNGGEDIFQWSDSQGINLWNIQKSPADQYQKSTQPNQKKKSFDPLAVQWENKKIIKKLIKKKKDASHKRKKIIKNKKCLQKKKKVRRSKEISPKRTHRWTKHIRKYVNINNY